MAASRPPHKSSPQLYRKRRLLWSLLVLLAGVTWVGVAILSQPATDANLPKAEQHTLLAPGVVATMDSPVFSYSPGWDVSSYGADPREPADPWMEPSGTVTFTYVGRTLDLQIAAGDYWGYLYVTVDGQPADAIPAIAGNTNSRGETAGYATLYEPDNAGSSQPAPRWQRIHQSPVIGPPHTVVLEIWRSWGQVPLRAVAVDVFPSPPLPTWPGLALILVAAGALLFWGGTESLHAIRQREPAPLNRFRRRLQARARVLALPQLADRYRIFLAIVFVGGLALAVYFDSWLFTLVALAGLAYASLMRTVLWPSVLLFALPYYYSVTLPVLPNRDLGIVDVGVFGGLIVVILGWFIATEEQKSAQSAAQASIFFPPSVGWSLVILIGWALISALASANVDVALHEWRTVFLAAGLFGLILHFVFMNGNDAGGDLWLLIGAWLAGATTVAAVGLWQLTEGSNLITAEGVLRIRALYGSPNNLALYLERSVVVCLSLVLLAPKYRVWWLSFSAIQGLALLLTFSKGSLLLGLPAGLITLALTATFYLRRTQSKLRPVWWLAVPVLLAMAVLGPFIGTERFQNLLDFSQGTAFLRLHLWRSAWQMALDHPTVGVGPDNFLYWFRSTYLLPEAWQEPNLNHPHNVILDLWTRIGIPGLIAGLAFYVTGTTGLIRRIRIASEEQRAFTALNIGFLAAAVAAFVHGLIDTSYALPDLMLIWVLLFGVGIKAKSWQYPRPT